MEPVSSVVSTFTTPNTLVVADGIVTTLALGVNGASFTVTPLSELFHLVLSSDVTWIVVFAVCAVSGAIAEASSFLSSRSLSAAAVTLSLLKITVVIAEFITAFVEPLSSSVSIFTTPKSVVVADGMSTILSLTVSGTALTDTPLNALSNFSLSSAVT